VGGDGLPLLRLGPAALRPTGLLIAGGLLLGLAVARRAARRDGLDPAPLARLAVAALAGGLAGAHLVHLLAYHPEELRDPWALLRLGDGLSSMGGLAGGAAAALLLFRGRRPGLAAYGDALALGLAPGWAVGRVGCALVHDHPGRLTTFPLAVAFPDGPRHDLGAYEAVLLALLAALLAGLRGAGRARGRLLPLLALGYGAGRFALDALRATDLPGSDPRLAGLTPAQWACLLLLGWGLAALRAPRAVW
jgi:phosphatidylglycerol:prolipoprotein diacylglycerol transferase